ncbi:MAG: hypothetical protein RQ767_01120 [Thermovirgaceae bacterium]|nr:hypothetical protein [Thermovirgaceae bacterium]
MQEMKVTGFPSPAAPWSEGPLDIADLLVPNPVSTFFMCLEEDVPAWHLLEGDILVVDRSCAPGVDDLAVAVQDGELLLRVVARKGRHLALKHPDGTPCSVSDAEVWGAIRAVVRMA